jgi:PAS domain S-box-containing protein
MRYFRVFFALLVAALLAAMVSNRVPGSAGFQAPENAESEALASASFPSPLLPISVFGFLLALTALAGFFWQRFRKAHYKALYEAQAARRESEEKYHELVETANNIILRIDAEGNVLYYNKFAESFFGYPEEEIVGRNAVGTLTPERDVLGRDMRAIIREASEFPERYIHLETEILCKDGSSGWVSWTNKAVENEEGEVVEFLCIGNDVTERKRLDAERDRLITAIEQSNDVITITDTEGNITYANPAFEDVTGFSPEKVNGKNTRFLKSGKHDPEFYENLWRTIRSGKVWTGRFINKKKDGSLFTEDATISPVVDASGQITHYVKVARDVTEELNRETQLQRAQRMEAVGQLAGGVAHDFNNLLQVITGYTQIEMMRTGLGENEKDNLLQIKAAAEKAAVLTRQLLAFSKRQVLQPVNLDLNDILSDLLKLLNRLIGEHVQLEVKPHPELRSVLADPGQIEQIVMNLAVNARDAMPQGGAITLQTENVYLDDSFCEAHPWAKKGGYALLTFSDTGVGMTEEVKEHLFEPFFTTKEPGKGTGLGLATVYGIVKQHNGFIHVYSEKDAGTTFKIYLPVAVGEKVTLKKAAQAPAQGGNETILVAEDDPNVRGLIETILERSGYKVLIATDGAEAIRTFESAIDEIDLVLLDIVMPNLGGRSACEAMLEKKAELKFIFCSGYNPDAFGQNFQIDERFEFIPKPFSPDDLLRKVRGVLDAPREV